MLVWSFSFRLACQYLNDFIVHFWDYIGTASQNPSMQGTSTCIFCSAVLHSVSMYRYGNCLYVCLCVCLYAKRLCVSSCLYMQIVCACVCVCVCLCTRLLHDMRHGTWCTFSFSTFEPIFLSLFFLNKSRTSPCIIVCSDRERDNLLYYTLKQSVPSLVTCNSNRHSQWHYVQVFLIFR
jgi:hypothetical protein